MDGGLNLGQFYLPALGKEEPQRIERIVGLYGGNNGKSDKVSGKHKEGFLRHALAKESSLGLKVTLCLIFRNATTRVLTAPLLNYAFEG